MNFQVTQHDQSRAQRVSNFLQYVDYRIASDEIARNRIFRLRYRAYLREGAIRPNSQMRFADEYDRLENCYIFGLYHEDRLISSIRVHVISAKFPYGPALGVFPEIVQPMLDSGKTVIDPTRFVIDEVAAAEFPDLPFLTLRVACMASEYFGADYCLATVRTEHGAFYRRVFKSKLLCKPRPYPSLEQPICLLRADVKSIRDEIMARYPVFLSSLTERRMLFEGAQPAVDGKKHLHRFVTERAASAG